MPTLKGELSDMVGILSPRQAGKIRTEIKRFAREFPQLQFHAFLTSVSSDHPISTYAFWLFNGSGMCSHLQKGGLNFHTLLVIDVEHGRSNLSVGYGIEPFVADDDLRRALEAGQEALQAKDYGQAVVAIIEMIREVYHEKSARIPQTFGMRPKTRDDSAAF